MITGDITVGAGAACDDLVLLSRAVERAGPRCVRRPSPTTGPPKPYPDRIDREDAVARLAGAVGAGGYVNLRGDEGIGKHTVSVHRSRRRQRRTVWCGSKADGARW